MTIFSHFRHRRQLDHFSACTYDLTDACGPAIVQALRSHPEIPQSEGTAAALYPQEFSACEDCGVLRKGAHTCAKVETLRAPLVMRSRGC